MKAIMRTTVLFFSIMMLLPSFAAGENLSTAQGSMEAIYICPMHPEVRQAEPGLCPICGMVLVPEKTGATDQELSPAEPSAPPHSHREPEPVSGIEEMTTTPAGEEPAETLYICPMHPQFRSPEPGSCPICGMDLVAMQRETESLPVSHVRGFATIKIDPQQQWLIGVKTAPVVRKNLTRQLRTVGTVAYDPGLYVAQKEYLEALKTGRAAASQSLIEAVYRKLILLGMSPAEIQELESKGSVDESLFLTEGTGRAWIYSVIYESERPLLRKGLTVNVKTVGHPQMKYAGRIDAITPVVDPMNRTIRVRSRVEDPIGLLQPDMFVDVFIEIPLGNALIVPKSAILQTGLRNIALVAIGEGVFQPREVVLGNQSNDSYQIISGLKEGEMVVTSANFLLDSESQLKGAFQSMEGHQHGQ